ncbi:MAG: HNH endonuclease [Ktedonobacterales bacterium]
MRERIGAPLRREIVRRAQHRCEYCGMPDAEAVVPHEPDHVIAVQHGGKTTSENLAYACFDCNRVKGSNISSIDPVTGLLTPLYNPRTQPWADHFRWAGAIIEPLTAVGRATAFFLRLNESVLVEVRENLQRQGRY